MYQAYKGCFQNGRFVPSEPVTIPDNTEVYVMVVGDKSPQLSADDKRKAHRKAFEKFFKAIAEIDDEPIDDDFLAKRFNITRELDL